MTSKFADAFDRNGYFIVERLLPADEIERIREGIWDIVAHTDRWPGPMFHYADGSDTPSAISSGHLYDWRFVEWARDERILEIVTPLLGDDIAVYNTSVFMKPPHSPGVIPWHQDQIYYAVETDFLVACWIALTDVTIENGAIEYLPGSHLEGVLPTAPTTDPAAADTFDRTVAHVDDTRAAAVPIEAGSAIFHHSLCAHRSGPNVTDEPRWALALDYMRADYRFAAEGHRRRVYPVVQGKRAENV